MAWYDAFTKPVRGIGRILRGKVQEGLNDIGDSASKLAPAVAFIPGVGPIGAGALGGIGKLLEETTDNDKGVDIGGVAMAGAGGYGAGKLAGAVGGASGLVDAAKGGLKGIGSLVTGGGGGAAATTSSAAAPGIGVGGGTTYSLGSAANTGAKAAGGMDALTKVALGSQVAGSAANAYGAHQMGKVEDRRMSLEEEEIARRRNRQEGLDPVRAAILKRLLGDLNVTERAAV